MEKQDSFGAMSEQAATEDLGGDLEIETQPKKGLKGKTLVLFIILPLLLLIGGGAGAYFAGLLDPLLGKEQTQQADAQEEILASSAVFYDLPDMLVNLNSSGNRKRFLKISIALELSSEDDVQHVETYLPRIVDNFQVYLRELRVEDLSGSAGLQRLREELLLRVNTAIRPAQVRDVLFKEMLVQ